MNLTSINTESPCAVAFAESRKGGRNENQDSWGWADTPIGLLITVCDGMGGGPGGKTASSIAVKEIIDSVMEADLKETASNILIKAILRANIEIIKCGQEQLQLQGMGSTCTALLINKESALVAHVGDSRVYQLRGKRKIFRTFDHSLVFELVKQKVITEEQARLSAQSNVITRALGINKDLEVEVSERSYEVGDRFLLCTDGIHGAVSEKELIRMSTRNIALGALTDDIATEIDSAGRKIGGHDNLTLVFVETKLNSIKTETMSKKMKSLLMGIGITCIVSMLINIGLVINSTKLSNKLEQTNYVQIDSLLNIKKNLEIQINELKGDTLRLRKELREKKN